MYYLSIYIDLYVCVCARVCVHMYTYHMLPFILFGACAVNFQLIPNIYIYICGYVCCKYIYVHMHSIRVYIDIVIHNCVDYCVILSVHSITISSYTHNHTL